MSWYAWEKELHPEAAKEDAEKLYTELSSLFHQALFYQMIYPTGLHKFLEVNPRQFERLQNPRDFLQEVFKGLGFETFNITAILIAALQSVYKFITSDLNEQGLDPFYQDVLESYTNLLYRIYPAFHAHGSAPRGPFVSKKLEFNIYSDEVLSKAVSPRFTMAVRMLSIRQQIVGAMTEYETSDSKFTIIPDESATVSAPDLAFLAGMAYSYITKLYREGRLPAQTRGKFIHIPVMAAVAFTASRPTAPTWIKTLASQKNIKPRGVKHTAADYLI